MLTSRMHASLPVVLVACLAILAAPGAGAQARGPAAGRDIPAQACAGNDYVMVLDRGGRIWSWGGSTGNGDGQMGLGDDSELAFLAGAQGGGGAWHFAAQKVGDGFAAIACQESRSAAIGADGTLWSWGSGPVGDGRDAGVPAHRPARVGTGFAHVAVGDGYTLALKADGSAWAWGTNAHGQLGDGGKETRLVPVMVGSGFARIAAGRTHSAGIRVDGTLWTWGSNDRGQLGLGDPARGAPTEALRPVQVARDIAAVAVADTYSAAVARGGDLLAWGHSRHGFGRGREEDHDAAPVRIGTGFVDVVMDHAHALALKADGSAWEWGYRTRGPRNLVPVRVAGDIAFLAAGGYASAAIGKDGALWLWGSDDWQYLLDRGGYPGFGVDRDSFFLSEPTRFAFPLEARRAAR